MVEQVLDAKEEVEKQHRESVKKLNSAVERQEKDLSTLQTENEELHEMNRSLQATLDASYKYMHMLFLRLWKKVKAECRMKCKKRTGIHTETELQSFQSFFQRYMIVPYRHKLSV